MAPYGLVQKNVNNSIQYTMKKVETKVLDLYERSKRSYAVINASAKPVDLGFKKGFRYEVDVTGAVNVLVIDIPKNRIPGDKLGIMLFNLPGEYKGSKVTVALTEQEALKLGLDGQGQAPDKCFVTVQSYEKKVVVEGKESIQTVEYIAFTENREIPSSSDINVTETVEVNTESAEAVHS